MNNKTITISNRSDTNNIKNNNYNYINNPKGKIRNFILFYKNLIERFNDQLPFF